MPTPKRKSARPPSAEDSKLHPMCAGFPQRLAQARKKKNLSQNKLGELAGLGDGQVSRYENGKRLGGFEVTTAASLAQALGVRLGWLLAGEDTDERRSFPPGLVLDADALSDPDFPDRLAALLQSVRDRRTPPGGSEPH